MSVSGGQAGGLDARVGAYVVRLDGEAGQQFAVTEAGLLIGRRSDLAAEPPDIALRAGGTASRRHARIFVEGGRCWVEDLGSKNGTFVAGQRIEGRRVLESGERITIGDQQLVVLLDDEPARRAAPAADEHQVENAPAPAREEAKPRDWAPPRPRRDGRTRLQSLVEFDSAPPEVAAPAPTPVAYTGAPLRLGRSADNEMVLGDPNVSRHHAVIEPGPSGPLLRDLESRNGTRLNGERIADAAPLLPGAEIAIGPFRLTF